MAMHLAPYPFCVAVQTSVVMERSGVYLQTDSRFWMIRFRYRGRLIRESSGTHSKREAIAYRRRRMAEFGLGRGIVRLEVPTLREAADALLMHIAAAKKSGYPQVRSHLKSLMAHFGADTRIAEILPDRMEGFVNARRAAGLMDASVHNEMSTLRRCLRLQWRRGRLLTLPDFPMPPSGKARQGFFTREEVERLCRFLPAHAVNAVCFAWKTGWRRGEIFSLRWSDVDWDAGVLFLTDSKNGEPRQLPFAESDELVRILREQRVCSARIELSRGIRVEHVFHYAGRQLPEGLRRCWGSACRKAGLESRLFHDLRRSFIQRCEDLSVARSSAMKITGHKTEAIYARYAIAPRSSLAQALKTLANPEHRPLIDNADKPQRA
jgi:integrase